MCQNAYKCLYVRVLLFVLLVWFFFFKFVLVFVGGKFLSSAYW